MGRVLVVNGLLKRLLLRMRLLLERLLLLRKHLQQLTKRHRPCCAVEAGARSLSMHGCYLFLLLRWQMNLVPSKFPF